ncbi:MAG TPA: hypothetical protein VN380_24980 [Thermoanaerobaculia bacterium]|jgi:hypothetical protein|nr:hypothetical protein [Thermoanaerobaculia bacterium]
MKRAGALIVLLTVNGSCGQRSSGVTLNVIAAERNAVTVGVRNDTAGDVVLLSPIAPSRLVDEGQCRLTLSTKIDHQIRPFAFAPTLVVLARGGEMRFRSILDPLLLSGGCSRWSVSAEYAYLSRDEVEGFRGRTSEDFRQYVLKHQQIATATVTLAVRD